MSLVKQLRYNFQLRLQDDGGDLTMKIIQAVISTMRKTPLYTYMFPVSLFEAGFVVSVLCIVYNEILEK